MLPNRHAVLSASSSHRWLHCNPSARLELEFEDRETEAAAEGTAAHALAEHKLRKALKMRSTRPVSKYDSDEMEMYTDSYLEFVLEAIEEARQDCPDPNVLIEQRLDFSCYVPDGFGTGDCLIVADKLLHIIDLKYGQGVLVNAEENPQMIQFYGANRTGRYAGRLIQVQNLPQNHLPDLDIARALVRSGNTDAVEMLYALTEFDEKLWLTTIEKVTVHTDGRMTFRFQCGVEVTL